LRTKSQKVVGTTRDSILAIYATKNKTRMFDRSEEEFKRGEIAEDDEEDPRKNDNFYVCCVDESEIVYVFSHKSALDPRKGGFCHKIRDCKDLPEEIRNKDLFGMGYPYYICMYENKVAISSDYGVAFLEITNTESF